MHCCNSVTSQCAAMCYCHIFMNLNCDVSQQWVLLCSQIYCLKGMFYQRENIKSAKHFAPNYRLTTEICCCIFRFTFYQCKYHLYIFFCIFFVRCFLNSTLIKKKKSNHDLLSFEQRLCLMCSVTVNETIWPIQTAWNSRCSNESARISWERFLETSSSLKWKQETNIAHQDANSKRKWLDLRNSLFYFK